MSVNAAMWYIHTTYSELKYDQARKWASITIQRVRYFLPIVISANAPRIAYPSPPPKIGLMNFQKPKDWHALCNLKKILTFSNLARNKHYDFSCAATHSD